MQVFVVVAPKVPKLASQVQPVSLGYEGNNETENNHIHSGINDD